MTWLIRADDSGYVFSEISRAGRHFRTVASRLIEGTYPQWEKVMPGATPYRVEFDVADWIKALTTVVKFARTGGGIELAGGPGGECTFRTSNPDIGETGHAVPAGGNLADGDMAPFFRGRYLLEYLKSLPTDARVALGVQEKGGKGDEASQMLVWPTGGDDDVDSRYVIMPMRR